MPTQLHMIAEEHMGIVNALTYGLTRDYATLSAALGAIGSTPAMLLLPHDGNGVWTFNTAWTIPTNVTLYIPPGVVVNGSGHATLNGLSVTYNPFWFQGTGGLTVAPVPVSFSAVQANKVGINTNVPAAPLHLLPTSTGVVSECRIEELAANDQAKITFYSQGTVRGGFGLVGAQNIELVLTNSALFKVTGGFVGLGMTPVHLLQLSADDAAKPTTNTWTIVSDARLKEVLRPYTDGLAVIEQVEPVWYTYNGKGGMEADGAEHVGLLAQDLQPVAPYMVQSSMRQLESTDTEDTELLMYQGHAMTFALINAVKELAARVAQLEAAQGAA